jgi:hypothetical protein
VTTGFDHISVGCVVVDLCSAAEGVGRVGGIGDDHIRDDCISDDGFGDDPFRLRLYHRYSRIGNGRRSAM